MRSQPLDPDRKVPRPELEITRQQIEEGFDNIADVDDEITRDRRSQLALPDRGASAERRMTGAILESAHAG
jgi:hypothetical protein